MRRSNIKNIGSVSMNFYGGASIETPETRGISHIVEHCMCNPLIKDMEKASFKGVSFNAYTSFNEIVFELSGFQKSIEKFRTDFFKRILDFDITEECFEKERKIVEQEFLNTVSEGFDAFGINNLRRDFNFFGSIGDLDVIRNIGYSDFIRFKDRFYSDPSRFLEVVPSRHRGIDVGSVTSRFSDNRKDIVPVKRGEYDVPLIDENVDPKAACSEVSMSCPFSETDKARTAYMLNLMTDYFSGGITSPMYAELREKRNMCYNIVPSFSILPGNIAHVSFMTMVDIGRAKEAADVMSGIIEKTSKRKTFKYLRNRMKGIRAEALVSNTLEFSPDMDDPIEMEINEMSLKADVSNDEFGSFLRSFVERGITVHVQEK